MKRSGFNKLNLRKRLAEFIIYTFTSMIFLENTKLKIQRVALYSALPILFAAIIVGGACTAGSDLNPNAPVISSLVAEHTNLYPLGNTVITCSAVSPQGTPLNYKWVSSDGTITGSGSSITYEAPKTYGDFHVVATVDDGLGNTASKTVTVTVRDPSQCCR
jgi:hypothetical protein